MAVKRAYIVQPINGRPQDEIAADRLRAISHLTQFGYEVIKEFDTDSIIADSSLDDGIVHQDLLFIGMACGRMSMCDAAYFMEGWEESNLCKMQHAIAMLGGLQLIYENPILLNRM